jgi:hypothetical protein
MSTKKKKVIPGVPHWATLSGVPVIHLRTFFAFLREKNIVFADNSEMKCTCESRVAVPTVPHSEFGFLNSHPVCEKCCETCAICKEPTIQFYYNPKTGKEDACHACGLLRLDFKTGLSF